MICDRPSLLSSKTGEHVFNVQEVLYQTKYCNQDEFSIFVCGGRTQNENTLNDVYELKESNFECSKFSTMLEARYECKTAVVNSYIVVVGGYKNAHKNSCSVELLKSNKNHWIYKTELPDKGEYFFICSFKQNLYIIGGRNNNGRILKSCFVYNMKCDIWNQIADMHEQRELADCTVYEGRIVVSGGWNNGSLKSREAHDNYENKWAYLPDMIEIRHVHASISTGNKLFVIGGYEKSTCETFDSYSRKFSYIKTYAEFNSMSDFQAVCVRNQIIIFCENSNKCKTKMFTYNVETSEWKLIDCKYLENKCGCSYVKYHQYLP